jgi:type IV pilus assembly protein PilM
LIFKRSKSNVAVDIGSGVVKIVEVDRSSGAPRVVSLAISSLLPGAIVDGEVMDHHLVAETIRSLHKGLGLSNRKVSTSVSGRDVIVKKISMDRMKEQEAREVIRWEAEQHVPFDMENVNLDFQILDPDGDGLEMSVLLVAAKRTLLESRTALLEDAGLEPVRIDVDAFAVQTAFEANYTPEERAVYALVNVGHEATNVNLLAGTDPILTRDLPIGSRSFMEALQKNLGLSQDDASAALQGRPPAHVSLETVKAELLEISREIAAGVDRARAFLTSGSGGPETGGELRLIYLSGGCARIPGLAEHLGQALSTPVDTLDPFRRVAYEPSLFTEESRRELGPMLALAVGLALQD